MSRRSLEHRHGWSSGIRSVRRSPPRRRQVRRSRHRSARAWMRGPLHGGWVAARSAPLVGPPRPGRPRAETRPVRRDGECPCATCWQRRARRDGCRKADRHKRDNNGWKVHRSTAEIFHRAWTDAEFGRKSGPPSHLLPRIFRGGRPDGDRMDARQLDGNPRAPVELPGTRSGCPAASYGPSPGAGPEIAVRPCLPRQCRASPWTGPGPPPRRPARRTRSRRHQPARDPADERLPHAAGPLPRMGLASPTEHGPPVDRLTSLSSHLRVRMRMAARCSAA